MKAAAWKRNSFNAFTKDNRITLVLDKNHADFQVAQDIADLINSQMGKQVSNYAPLAHAFNQGNIVVRYSGPISRRSGVVRFPGAVAADHGAADRAAGGHQRAGRHDRDQRRRGNRLRGRHPQEPGHRSRRPAPRRGPFVRRRSGRSDLAETEGPGRSPERRPCPPEDIIEIIKGLDRDGKLHAPLIIE